MKNNHKAILATMSAQQLTIKALFAEIAVLRTRIERMKSWACSKCKGVVA